jgi:hypothetical protein
MTLRITPTPLGPGYRGRRARRQAFYHRQRCARVLSRVARELGQAFNAQMSGAWRDMLVYGTAWIGVSRPAAAQTFYDASGAEVPPPDGSPRDGSIASMLSVRHVSRDEYYDDWRTP